MLLFLYQVVPERHNNLAVKRDKGVEYTIFTPVCKTVRMLD